ncbi:MAG: hypothetical protein DRO09_04060, partial [Thermoprotei archaeon]
VSVVPVMPELHTLRQADGTEFKARLWGDEWNNGFETLDGYTIIFNESSGNWEYAILGRDGELRCSGKVVTKDLPDGIPKKIRPKVNRPKALLALSTQQKFTPSTGNVSIPVILIHFPDQVNTYTVEDFENLLFNDSKGVRAYYKEVSYGKLLLSGNVSGWYVADNVHDYYGEKQGIEKAAELVREAVQKADAAIDFSKYDNDEDGYVDVVVVVHSGTGTEDSGNLNDIWSHQGYLSFAGVGTYLTDDGVIVDRYTIQPEILSDGELVTIGIFCHEFGHALGLPDLYDKDYSSNGVGDWDIMASGCWLGKQGDTPSHFSAWCKWYLGWITPIQVVGALINRTIKCVEESGEVYQLLPNPNGPTDWVMGEHTGVGEYFLVENRYKIGFDAALPGEGLLIWHIDESMPDNDNEDHKLVDLEEADGLNDLDNCVNYGDATDPWYNSSGFTEISNPNSNLYNGTPSGVKVVNISFPGKVMTADLIVEFTTIISVDSPEEVAVDEEFQVTISVEDVQGLTAFTFKLAFDEDLVEYQGYELTDVIADWTVQEATGAGYVSLVVYTGGEGIDATQKTDVVTLTFKALAEGTNTFDLQDSDNTGYTANGQTSVFDELVDDTTNITESIMGIYDKNDDGEISGLELLTAIDDWREGELTGLQLLELINVWRESLTMGVVAVP